MVQGFRFKRFTGSTVKLLKSMVSFSPSSCKVRKKGPALEELMLMLVLKPNVMGVRV